MPQALPDDVLHLICEQLAQQKDFGTLYFCARAGKELALPALSSLYRIQDTAPFTSSGGDEADISRRQAGTITFASRVAQQDRLIGRWANMWHSIILSSLDKTLYPYCRFIRLLNLRDLGYLLEDTKFRDKFEETFFFPDLEHFYTPSDTRSKGNRLRNKMSARLNVVAIIDAIGEAITRKVSVLEEISGQLRSSALLTWMPRLGRLQSMTLWRGDALEGGVEELIRKHCPLFRQLTFYEWASDDCDEKLAKFFMGLRPDSLESFQIYSNSGIGARSFLALRHHRQSLTSLKLASLQTEAIHRINYLKYCTALKVLHLQDGSGVSQGVTQLETHHMDTFLEVVNWLRSCTKLEDLELSKFSDGPALMTPLLLENVPSLAKISLEGYVMCENLAFHQALAYQTHLTSLSLKGDGDDVTWEDVNVLVTSLSKLTNLTDLSLKDVSDYFRDGHIMRLATSLPKLEEFWVSGWGITDAIWEAFNNTPNLRVLTFAAMTGFTYEGIMDFIAGLGPGNRGFLLSIMNADAESKLTEEQQNAIREVLAVQLDGRFEFTLFRDDDVSPYTDSGSD